MTRALANMENWLTKAAFSGPKKSGKTAFGAMLVFYVIVALGGRYAEAYCAANDFEQSQGRVFQAIGRILDASPLFLRIG
jgi:hypothetical protein